MNKLRSVNKIFTRKELLELKASLNELIGSRIVYLNSDISEKEIEFTKNKLNEDNELLKKVLRLIISL